MADPKPSSATHRPVPAVTRAIRILRRLGAAAEPMGVNPLARDLGLVPSTCLHILRVLTAEGLVEFDPASKRYSIGVGILPIARSAIQRNGFATLAQPMLAALSEQFGVTAMATQLVEPQQMVVVALSHANLPLRLSAELGSRFPELISATGRCVAAFNGYDAATLRQRFAQLHWDNPPAFAAWMEEVEQTRRDGHGIDRGAYIGGVTIVAVPLFNDAGAMVRGLVGIGLSDRIEAT
ncbi:MAG: IclR family transcriptional regulator, partial [Alphaproteobacteria bacterium]|nr:IclR family transcriptional regulator [Alphaproteobacteria bacterium]